MTTLDRDFDIIIVGAGMVGAALASALGQQGWRVALVDRAAPQMAWPEQGYDPRVSAITHASQHLFASLGAWSLMQQQRISAYREMHVWDASGNGVIHFDAAELGEADLGHIIENRVIIKALHQTLEACSSVETVWPVQAVSLVNDTHEVRLLLQDGQTLHAPLIVGADGSRSWLRQQAGISVKGWDYDHTAVVTTVKPQHFHQETAWQRFLTSGPVAFLPLGDGMCSIVWSTSAPHARQLVEMDDGRFAVELQAAIDNRLGKIEAVDSRQAFPLRFFETEHYVQPRVALVGDAAHSIHPLAGQGVNLGLSDVAALVSVLGDTREAKKDPGSSIPLRRYERWRRADNRGMLLAMDGFKRLFSNPTPLVRWARNTGLNLTDRMPIIKNLLMQRALGH